MKVTNLEMSRRLNFLHGPTKYAWIRDTLGQREWKLVSMKKLNILELQNKIACQEWYAAFSLAELFNSIDSMQTTLHKSLRCDKISILRIVTWIASGKLIIPRDFISADGHKCDS